MVPLQSGRAITKELSYQIFDGMRYLCGNFDCEKVAQLFGKEMGSKTMWGMINEIATEFGLKNSYFVRDIPVALSIDVAEESVFPIDVEGYEYVVRIDGEVGELRVKVDVVENAVHLSDGQRLKETIFLDDLQSQIYGALVARYGTPTAYGNELPKEVLTFEGKGEKYAVKLYLESLRMKNPEYV
ncbi:MAG: hypothetical protein LBU27_08230 [Candidatus Peribacteria bacterium]|jgi:hypothetical protein|nr:hypothetical protein [Candidatus Peribacteria bacterium]